jgi:hypothetical protein
LPLHLSTLSMAPSSHFGQSASRLGGAGCLPRPLGGLLCSHHPLTG